MVRVVSDDVLVFEEVTQIDVTPPILPQFGEKLPRVFYLEGDRKYVDLEHVRTLNLDEVKERMKQITRRAGKELYYHHEEHWPPRAPTMTEEKVSEWREDRIQFLKGKPVTCVATLRVSTTTGEDKVWDVQCLPPDDPRVPKVKVI